MSKTQSRDANLIGRETIKHKGIVGVRAVSNADLPHLARSIAKGPCFLFRNYCHECGLQNCLLLSCFLLNPAMLPLRRNPRCHHYLDDFRKNKPVKPPAERLSDRVRPNGKPCQTSSEEYNFGEKSAQRGASKSSGPTFHHKSRQPSDDWIS